ncbi:MAG: hemerythrin family protein [Lachnospiraceae bacterium]|nr:hemerythrin family protein [Lachnospiraceae bacterium]
MFQFTEDCLLGVEEIDEEHRHLFELLNEGCDMLYNEYRGDKYEEIKELLGELEDYADQHFAHEEAYMEQICDPELILQRPQHLSFRETIVEFMLHNIDDEEEQQELLEELMNFLAKWLYHHILGSDILIGRLPPLEEWMIRENPCEFCDEYLTGNAMMDHEHRVLFELVEHTYNMVRNKKVNENYDEVVRVIKELTKYTKIHFTDEEEYMIEIQYEGYDAQKRAHEAFVARLEEEDLAKIGEDDLQTYMESLVQYLLEWLVHHILKEDKKIPCIESTLEENDDLDSIE